MSDMGTTPNVGGSMINMKSPAAQWMCCQRMDCQHAHRRLSSLPLRMNVRAHPLMLSLDI